jgi:hypothetical protein
MNIRTSLRVRCRQNDANGNTAAEALPSRAIAVDVELGDAQ